MHLDNATVVDILNAARSTIRFLEGINQSEFLDDDKTQSAVLHQLLVMGEAVKRLSPEFRTAHPQLPWRMMTGMRDKVVHEYDDVDLDEVWETVTGDVPRVIAVLEALEPRREGG